MPLVGNSKIKAALDLAEAFWTPDATQLYFNYLTVLYDGGILNLGHDKINEAIAELKDKFEGMAELSIPAQRQLYHNMLEDLKAPKHVIVDDDGEVEVVDTEESEDELFNHFLELLTRNEDFQTELEFIKNFKIYGQNIRKKMEQSYEGVALVTAHSSKGLEWDVVFNSLTNYDGPFMHSSGPRGKTALEERRRLLFVSLTRARDMLYVTGQYVAYSDKEGGKTYNQYLKECFEQNGDKYDPTDPNADIKAQQRRAKAAAAAKARREKAKDIWAGYSKNLPGQISMNFK